MNLTVFCNDPTVFNQEKKGTDPGCPKTSFALEKTCILLVRFGALYRSCSSLQKVGTQVTLCQNFTVKSKGNLVFKDLEAEFIKCFLAKSIKNLESK